MSVSDEDTYSMVFASLKHPIRRKILRMLSNEPESFSSLQKQFRIESSHLTYHLEGLGSLLLKTEDGKYTLSSVGEAAVSMMKHVEEPPGTSIVPHFLSTRRMRIWKPLTFLLICGLVASIVFSGVFLFKYTESEAAYSRLDKAYNGLNQAFDELNTINNGLNQAYAELNKTYNQLHDAYDYLNGTYLSLLKTNTQPYTVYDISAGLNYSTIQEAINAAQNGSIIVVSSGVYHEHILINKTLTLLGVDKEDTIIDGSNGSDVVAITADDVLFEGFTVRNSSMDSTGIALAHSTGSVVRGNVVTLNGWAGIGLSESNTTTVSDNIISSTTGSTIGLIWGDGIMLSSSSNNTINYNVITGSTVAGISLESSDNNTILGNVLEDNGYVMFFPTISNDNAIFQNSFMRVNNYATLGPGASNNTWSVGGRGNYWDDYTGLDDGSGGRVAGDGVGDTNIPWHGVDDYPLINPANSFSIFWENEAFPASLVSNTTVSAFTFDQTGKKITFNVIGPANTTGYFNLSIPTRLLSDPWKILLDGADATSRAVIVENQTHITIYLSYNHSSHNVQIIGTNVIPEYQTADIFLLGIILTLPPTTLILEKKMKLLSHEELTAN